MEVGKIYLRKECRGSRVNSKWKCAKAWACQVFLRQTENVRRLEQNEKGGSRGDKV